MSSIVKTQVEMNVGRNGEITLSEIREFLAASNYMRGNALVNIYQSEDNQGTIISVAEHVVKQLS